MRGLGLVGSLCALACAWIVCCCMTASASALSAERAYEMVSPPFKGGFGATLLEAVAPDGEAVAFFSPGSFAGAPSGLAVMGYLAVRDEGRQGWSTAPLMTPASQLPNILKSDITPSLDLVMRLGWPGPNSENFLNEVNLLLRSTLDTSDRSGWELDGTIQPLNAELLEPLYKGASAEFCNVLLSSDGGTPLTPEGEGVSQELYQFNRGCGGGQASIALVGLNNIGKLIDPRCFTTIGDEAYTSGGTNEFNAISSDGSEVFFTTCVKSSSSKEFGPSLPHQIFVRLGDARTLEISKPVGKCVSGGTLDEVPCDGAAERANADFAGASEDGSTVYFTTNAKLTPEDIDSGSDLYMAKIGCPEGNPTCGASEREVTSLTQVSHDPTPGQAADVTGVLRVAPDGTRAYFVAGGDLLSSAREESLEGEGRPVPRHGAANLYAYSASSGVVSFVGDLCSGRELSGTLVAVNCSSAKGTDELLWADSTNEAEVQTAGTDGRFLLFSSYAQLLSSDTNVVRDIYRYDASTDELVRVSGGEDGYGANGNRTVLNAAGEPIGSNMAKGQYGGSLLEQYELNGRAISEDGSRVVFASAEPLSPAAANGEENVYEWHEGPGEGSVSLISSGGFVGPVYEHLVISPNGLSVFFITTAGLAPQDADGAPDVYDARLGGGFAAPPMASRACESDACRGPLTNPLPLLIPGSVVQVPGGNLTAIKHVVKPRKAKRKARRSTRKSHRQLKGRRMVRNAALSK